MTHAAPLSRHRLRVLLVPLGIVAAQAILYAPSLTGRKLLLPLGCLAHPYTYLPPEHRRFDSSPDKWLISDAVLQVELDRIYAVREVRQGRLPFWNPYNYCGVPFLANNNSAVFSPFMIPSYLWPGPEALAWTQLLRALVAGIGAYLFFRRTMGVGFLPALLGAWTFPLTGFLVMWSWIHFSSVVSLLPWVLMATDAAVRGPAFRGVPLLAIATALTLVSGKLDTSAHVLLASGMFAVYGLIDQARGTDTATGAIRRSTLGTVCGWALGFGLAAPIVLPTQHYLQQSSRIEVRANGVVDFPGHGVDAIPPIVLPYIYGSDLEHFVGYGNVLESTSIGYAGFVTALFLVPLGWSGRRRSLNMFWAVAGICALAPHLEIPLLSNVYHLPVLNLLKNNRFIFFTSWCLVATAVAGIEVLQESPSWRWWFWIMIATAIGIGAWCAFAARRPPTAVAGLGNTAVVEAFRVRYLEGVALSALTVALYLGLRRRRWLSRRGAAVVCLLVVVELVYQAYGFLPQSSAELYYPPHPLMTEVSRLGPGRFCGVHIITPSLNRTQWLPSIRGYDGADPKSIIQLLQIANPDWEQTADYALTQDFVPEFSPILRMLNLRYRIGRGEPPAGLPVTRRAAGDWLHIDPDVLPRPYVPDNVVPVPTQEAAFYWIAHPDFDPREVAFVETHDEGVFQDVKGTAEIVHETPGHVVIHCNMESAGLVVLNDAWYDGWSATYEGTPVSVRRVNGALMGVYAPEGKGTIEMNYGPRTFLPGVFLMLLSLLTISAWFGAGRWRHGRQSAGAGEIVEN